MKKALPGVGYDPFVEVKLQPLYLFDKRLSNKNVVVVQNPKYVGKAEENPDELFIEAGIVSDDYKLITNQQVFDRTVEILRKADVTFAQKRTMFDGKRYSQRFIFGDDEYYLEPKTGDSVVIGIECFNSYDGSIPAGWSFFAERIDSSAGMVIDWLVGEFRFKHLNDGKWDEELAYFAKAVKDITGYQGGTQELNNAIVVMMDRLSADGLLSCLRDVPASAPLMAAAVWNIECPTSAVSKWAIYNGFMSELARKPSFANDKKNREISQYFIKSALQKSEIGRSPDDESNYGTSDTLDVGAVETNEKES